MEGFAGLVLDDLPAAFALVGQVDNAHNDSCQTSRQLNPETALPENEVAQELADLASLGRF